MADPLPGLGAEPDDEEQEVDAAPATVDEDDEPELQSGLGRGLAAIIPTLADLDTPAPSARRRRRRGGVAALLGGPTGDTPGDADDQPSPPASAPDPTSEVASEPPAPATLPEPAAVPSAVDASAPPDVAVASSSSSAGAAAGLPATVGVAAPSAVRKLRDDLVGALLDGLANTMALDLCAYLHEGSGEEPHLFLQSPSMDAIGADRAFALFTALHADLAAGRSRPEFAVAGFHGVSVATLGEGSRGLWAVARSDDVTNAEREVATRFCRSFGRAVHQLDGAAPPANAIARPVLVQAHRARDSVLAEVQVRLGDQIRSGHGRAVTQVEAITRAVLVAAGCHATFRYASEVAHEGEHAAVVLLEGGDHAVALGSARSPEPGGVATAQAALRALDGLTP